MKKIPQILLRTYLRRNPVHIRLSQFNMLSRYAWLKNVLEEIRPELFPAHDAEDVEVLDAAPAMPPETVQQLLDTEEVRGRQGIYQVRHWHGSRGQGQLFSAVQTESRQAVTIKEYLLNPNIFNREEALACQSRFMNLATLKLVDGRQSSFRVIRPLEAIADSNVPTRCYLVTPNTDQCPSLRTVLKQRGPVEPLLARKLLTQILQTLDFLHSQTFVFANGQRQVGLIHGQLTADTVLCQEQGGQEQGSQEQDGEIFLYLCDLLQWEQIFAPLSMPRLPIEATPEAIAKDLEAAAYLGISLLQGTVVESSIKSSGEPSKAIQKNIPIQKQIQWAGADPDFERFLQRLLEGESSLDTAEAAHRALVQLPPLHTDGDVFLPELEPEEKPKKRSRLHALALLSGLVLLGGVGAALLLPRLRSSAASQSPPSACCLAEISAVPTGEYRYSAVRRGTWDVVSRQQHLLKRNQSLGDALTNAHPKLELNYRPSSSIEESLGAVEKGDVDFAVVPLTEPLPIELAAQPIAYDGLAVVVPFSYSERRKSLPVALNGQLSVSQVQQLFTGNDSLWRAFGGNSVPIERFAPENPEAIALFEQQVLRPVAFEELGIVQDPTLQMLRYLIQGFEQYRLGGVGFSTLSQIRGQCSVYPLALKSRDRGRAVQPLLLDNGKSINPETDLCDRKGNIRPNFDAFQSGDYPLSYPIAVVYAQDNRRPPIGKKFAELMQTTEGQQLLSDAGLVPVETSWSSEVQNSTTQTGKQRSPGLKQPQFFSRFFRGVK